jgi:hypothetical protein
MRGHEMKKKKKGKKRKKLRVKELEKKVAPAPFVGKKPAIPGPYAPGTEYGLARRSNLK